MRSLSQDVDRVFIGLITFGVLVGFFLGCVRHADVPPKAPPIFINEDGGVYAEPFDVAGGYALPLCAYACANLQRRRCPDGSARSGEDSCYVVCRRAEQTGKIDLKPGCVADAGTVEAIRACGTYECR